MSVDDILKTQIKPEGKYNFFRRIFGKTTEISLLIIVIILVKLTLITYESHTDNKIKNMLMVDIAWGANNVYFTEKQKAQRTIACEGYKNEFEFKALYPKTNELGTLCFTNIDNYKVDWFYTDEELKEIQYQKHIKKINGIIKYEYDNVN